LGGSGRKAEAVERLKTAIQVYKQNGDKKEVAECKKTLEKLLK